MSYSVCKFEDRVRGNEEERECNAEKDTEILISKAPDVINEVIHYKNNAMGQRMEKGLYDRVTNQNTTKGHFLLAINTNGKLGFKISSLGWGFITDYIYI